MPSSIGTRTRNNFRHMRADQGEDTRSRNQDRGMTKRISGVACTFAAATGKVTAANGTFAGFVVNDTVEVQGVNINNGFFNVTGVDGVNNSFLVLDPPPANEGPLAATIRAA